MDWFCRGNRCVMLSAWTLAIRSISSAMKAELLAVLGWLRGRGVDLSQWYLMCVGASSLLTRCAMISFVEVLQVFGGLWAFSRSVPEVIPWLLMVGV